MKSIREELKLRVSTPYMLRNDGKVTRVSYGKDDAVVGHPYIIRDRDLSMRAAVRVAVLDRL